MKKNTVDLIAARLKRTLPQDMYDQVIFEFQSMNLEHEQLLEDIHGCEKCMLHKTCGVHVPGAGSILADMMFVGESPGAVEDQHGIPFSGPAGQLMNKMLEALRWNRKDIYITNVMKCRTDEKNRNPTKMEVAVCSVHLKKEIELVKPKVIVCWGNIAANSLIHPDFKITHEQGHWFDVNGIRTIAAFHPAYILRLGDGTAAQKKAKWDVWNVMQKVQKFMDAGFKDDLSSP
jgi:uracil-DNA glycosylase family 4